MTTTTMKRSKKATAANYAAMQFEPWVKTDDLPNEFVTRERWQALQSALFMVANYSYKQMFRSKAEMVADVASWDEDRGELMMRAFIDVRGFLASALEVVDSAEVRILVAGASSDADDLATTKRQKKASRQ